MEPITAPDYDREGREIDIRLLHALALGGHRSAEIQSLLERQSEKQTRYQALALYLTDLSVPKDRARVTFERLRGHQARMCESEGRAVGIKTAAMDYLECIEQALHLEENREHVLTYLQLTEMAFRDQLSGLANYRSFEQRFNEEVKRAARYHRTLSLVMLDLDRFKNLNDTHGHLAGNSALEHLARVLRTEARETDFIARYGGDEFAVIMPETTKHDALSVAERIRARVEKSPVELPDVGPQRLTVSVGLATYPRDSNSTDGLLASADQALYASKAAGRNRVTVFTPAGVAHFGYMPEKKSAVKSISVAGNFNGWNTTVDLMSRDSSGRFVLDLHLAPGTYTYKFVVNGKRYITDPRRTTSVPDGYGGRNSVIVVR
jgi:diguanylate cyclase (GGDEF)-like protein